MKNLLGNLKSEDVMKEIKSLDVKDSKNHEKILILLYILDNMNRNKNRCVYNLCRNMDEAIRFWKDADGFVSMIRNSCRL